MEIISCENPEDSLSSGTMSQKLEAPYSTLPRFIRSCGLKMVTSSLQGQIFCPKE